MSRKPLLWLAERLDELNAEGKSKSGLAKVLRKSPSAITAIIAGTREIALDEIRIVADYIGWSEASLMDRIRGEEVAPAHLEAIRVIGAVEAGVFSEAVEWPDDKRYLSPVSKVGKYAYLPQYGLEVRGESMNRIYPPGTILICVKLIDLGRNPRPGEKVIAYRTDKHGQVEATVKVLRQHEDQSYWLWPNSTHPSHQQPTPIAPVLPFSDDEGISLDALVIHALVDQTIDF